MFKLENSIKKRGLLIKKELIINNIGHQGCLKTIKNAVNSLLEQLKTEDKNYQNLSLVPIFRGESRDFGLTSLQPSMFRIMALKSKSPDYEKNAIEQFLKKYPKSKNDNLLLTLAFMQHYGNPTRLLDWTKKLEVALYFVCNKSLEDDGYLYVFIPTLTYEEKGQTKVTLKAFQTSIKHLYSKQCLIPHTEIDQVIFWINFCKEANTKMNNIDIPFCLAFEPSYDDEQNQREIIQQSVYTFHLGYVDGGKVYAGPQNFAKGFIQQHLCQIIIPARFKKQCLDKLEDRGICDKTLFP